MNNKKKPKDDKEAVMEVIADNELEFSEMINLDAAISQVKNKGLSIESIKNVVKLKIRLKTEMEAIQAMQEAVMDKFGVKKTSKGYSFKDHEHYDEIVAELDALQKSKTKIQGLHSVPEDELFAATPDVGTDVLAVLLEYISKK